MSCRICLEEGGTFVHPCSCKGEVGNVHPACLTRWVEESKHDYCEICHSKYNMKDRLACNIRRFCSGFCSCYMGRYNTTYSKFAFIIMGITCMTFFVNEFDFLIVQTAVTGLISAILLAYVYFFETEDFKDRFHNVIFIWKLAYSGPFFLNAFIYYLQFNQECEIGCGILHMECNEECPMWDALEAKQYTLMMLVTTEVFCIVCVFVIRMVIIAYYNFRKLQFVDFDDRESKPLLSSPINSPSSSSASGGSSASSSSSGDSISLDVEALGTGNTSVSAAD